MDFQKGQRVRHLVTGEVGTVLREWDGVAFVRVQFDDDFDEDGIGWPWTTEPEKLEPAPPTSPRS